VGTNSRRSVVNDPLRLRAVPLSTTGLLQRGITNSFLYSAGIEKKPNFASSGAAGVPV
jgi:hypothetical protein